MLWYKTRQRFGRRLARRAEGPKIAQRRFEPILPACRWPGFFGFFIRVRRQNTVFWLKLHPLNGGEKAYWAIGVSGNRRLTFKFDGEDAILVDYRDYH
ncbi:MAG TPA: type II toxin-antitoxin system RelE/ParE family toxin [Woeseiaceae bacterium]|nr:type II toxin-antitoxin system RelE/ParE family toxin [Woeseiaceae bacterium]